MELIYHIQSLFEAPDLVGQINHRLQVGVACAKHGRRGGLSITTKSCWIRSAGGSGLPGARWYSWLSKVGCDRTWGIERIDIDGPSRDELPTKKGFHNLLNYERVPSGNLIWPFKTHYKWPFSIAMLNWERVNQPMVQQNPPHPIIAAYVESICTLRPNLGSN